MTSNMDLKCIYCDDAAPPNWQGTWEPVGVNQDATLVGGVICPECKTRVDSGEIG